MIQSYLSCFHCLHEVLKFEVVKFQSGPTFLGDKGPNVLGDTALFKVLGTLDNNNIYIYIWGYKM